MRLGVLCTVWVWDMAAEASEWGSLSFKAVLCSDDGGPIACQLLKMTRENTKNLEQMNLTQMDMHAEFAQSLIQESFKR